MQFCLVPGWLRFGRSATEVPKHHFHTRRKPAHAHHGSSKDDLWVDVLGLTNVTTKQFQNLSARSFVFAFDMCCLEVNSFFSFLFEASKWTCFAKGLQNFAAFIMPFCFVPLPNTWQLSAVPLWDMPRTDTGSTSMLLRHACLWELPQRQTSGVEQQPGSKRPATAASLAQVTADTDMGRTSAMGAMRWHDHL